MMFHKPMTAWRYFPLALLASLGVVIAVNIGLAYAALSTFPGLATADDFDTSNRYDRVLETAQRQAALGWALSVRVEEAHPVLVLIGPKTPAAITATAQRPLGPPLQTSLHLLAQGDGTYRADTALGEPGQWDLQLRIDADGQTITATRRIIVP